MELDDSSVEILDPVNTKSKTPLPKRKKKPSVSTPWTCSAINDLILAVEEHSCVWVYSCSDYKDRIKREQAWREIKKRCPGYTVDDCKAKWSNLKTVFQSVKKKMTTKSGQDAHIKPHWPHWTSMQFFNRHSAAKCSPTVSRLDVQETDVKNSLSQYHSLPGTSSSSLSETYTKEEKDIFQRAVQCLEAEEDNWHAIGMYLASQMREIAKKNKNDANKLHVQLVRVVMDATLKAEVDN